MSKQFDKAITKEYQERLDCAIYWVKCTIEIIKKQPTENDEWILNRLYSLLKLMNYGEIWYKPDQEKLDAKWGEV